MGKNTEQIIECIDNTLEELNRLVEELKVHENILSFPDKLGEPCEMYVDGQWVRGKIVYGYRFRDGVVTIEDAAGKRYSCGANRRDMYRPCEAKDEDRVD